MEKLKRAEKSKKSVKVNFARLAKALHTLKFELKQSPGFSAFYNAEQDALIVLPLMRPSQIVDGAHITTVMHTVTGKGIASDSHLHTLLFGRRATGTGLRLATDRGSGKVDAMSSGSTTSP